MPVARLFNEQGQRLFFNEEERTAFIQAANKAPETTRTFCSLLHYTACNFTEAMTMTPQQVDFANSAISFQGLIPRLHYLTRAVPVPPSFLALLDDVHGIRRAQSGPHATERIWPQSKGTLHEKVSRVIAAAGIAGGPHAVPKGIRHGYLVHALRRRILLTRVSRWMGYSNIDYIAEYIDSLAHHAPELLGDEDTDATLMWS